MFKKMGSCSNLNKSLILLLIIILLQATAGCGREEKSAGNLLSGTVERVVDGDTASIRLADGKLEKVRFIGVDTPETKHPDRAVELYGPEAAEYTRSKLEDKRVFIELDAAKRDKYGRLLAYIWLQQPVSINESEIRTKMFNARLLMEGYAQVLTIPPNVKYMDQFKKYQAEAREMNKGFWGLEKQGQIVYITETGERYHLESCRYVARSRIPVSLPDARVKGYDPCKVCQPPN